MDRTNVPSVVNCHLQNLNKEKIFQSLAYLINRRIQNFHYTWDANENGKPMDHGSGSFLKRTLIETESKIAEYVHEKNEVQKTEKNRWTLTIKKMHELLLKKVYSESMERIHQIYNQSNRLSCIMTDN